MRITASQLRKIIKEEISRMNESRDRGTMWDPYADRYGRGDPGDYPKDFDQEDEYERPGQSEDAYEFRYGLKFPSKHPSYGQDFGSASEGRAAYMAWKRSKT